MPEKFVPLAQIEANWYGPPNALFKDTVLENTVRQCIVRAPQQLNADVQWAINFRDFWNCPYSNYKHASYGLRVRDWLNDHLEEFFRPFNPSHGPFAMAMTFTCRFESNSIEVWQKPSILLPTNYLPSVDALARLTNLPPPNHLRFNSRGLLEQMETLTYELSPTNDDVTKWVKPHSRGVYMEVEPQYLEKITYSDLLDTREDPPVDHACKTPSPRLSLSYDEEEDLPLPTAKKLCMGLDSQSEEIAV